MNSRANEYRAEDLLTLSKRSLTTALDLFTRLDVALRTIETLVTRGLEHAPPTLSASDRSAAQTLRDAVVAQRAELTCDVRPLLDTFIARMREL